MNWRWWWRARSDDIPNLLLLSKQIKVQNGNLNLLVLYLLRRWVRWQGVIGCQVSTKGQKSSSNKKFGITPFLLPITEETLHLLRWLQLNLSPNKENRFWKNPWGAPFSSTITVKADVKNAFGARTHQSWSQSCQWRLSIVRLFSLCISLGSTAKKYSERVLWAQKPLTQIFWRNEWGPPTSKMHLGLLAHSAHFFTSLAIKNAITYRFYCTFDNDQNARFRCSSTIMYCAP